MSERTELRYHPGVAGSDLLRIAAQLGSGPRLREFVLRMNTAISEVLDNRGTPSTQLRPPLNGWDRKKFHSRSLPPTGMSADARLIYRVVGDSDVLYILSVGMRLPGREQDIYALAGARLVHEK